MSDHHSPTDPDALREHFGPPSERALSKQHDRLDRQDRAFIALSPFLVLATAGADGRADASPRGDAPGFVAVLDDRTVLLPDRPGNNRLDSWHNVLENPHVGMIFFVPGHNRTLRINGRARLTVDPLVLSPHAVAGIPPRAALIVSTDEVYFQCQKALIRSDLWNPARHIVPEALAGFASVPADRNPGTEG